MAEYREACEILNVISMTGALENYNPNSYIVKGAFQLANMIINSIFPEETCHWIAESITSNNSWNQYIYIINEDLRHLFRRLMGILLRTVRDYSPEREGIPNPEFVKIITTPEDEFVTFFPGNIDIDDFDNDSHREILVQGNALDSEDESDNYPDLDTDDEDDFIDPENSPEYELYSEPLPRYEYRNNDKLLDAGIPLYSEFSWIRTMLFRAESLV
jgi:hypothetical protein